MSLASAPAPAGPTPATPATPRRNTASVLAVVFLFCCSPAAVVAGVVARRQIARTGERGRGMATVGIVGGSLSIVAGVLLALVVGHATTVQTPARSGPPTLPGATVASSITAQSHGQARDVVCPDLPMQPSAATVCTAQVHGEPVRIRVLVTAIDGPRVRFAFSQIR